MSDTQIYDSYKSFKKRTDMSTNGVSERFAEENPNWKEMNNSNSGCWNCLDCNNCSNCYGCTRCNGLDYSIDCVDTTAFSSLEVVDFDKPQKSESLY